METNINEKNTQQDVQLHKERIDAFSKNYGLNSEQAISAINLLDNSLGYGYTSEIVSRAKQKGMHISRQTVRLVKLGNTKNPQLFKILLEYATQQKAHGVAVRESIEKLTT